MSSTTARKCFFDSNVVLYLVGEDKAKKERAVSLLSLESIISTQVVNENVNVCLKKFKFTKEKTFSHANFLINRLNLVLIDEKTIITSFDIYSKYSLSYWDSLIVASALNSSCEILYSEDMQDNLIIEGTLTIKNPFKWITI